jgi:hypothetical protein
MTIPQKEITMHENDEREFLHDLASPLGTAAYIADAVLDSLAGGVAKDFPELEQLQQLQEALQKLTSKLSERREVLIQRGVQSQRGTL